MTEAAKRPSTATRRTGGSQSALNGHGPDKQDLRDEQDLVGDRDRDDGIDRDDRTDRHERDSDDEQREQRARREDRADDRDDRNERIERDSRDEQRDQRQRDERGEQWHGDRGELGDGREPRREPGGVQRTVEQATDRARSATSNPGDAFAGPDMSKVFTAWVDMVGDMMKLQQQFFSTVLGAGNTNDRNTTKV
jgi:hypothetical protein